ncbi:MAG: ThiF family adenylyltransferase [Nocardioides sp.]|nr:ThiF family adenylyltransferase [Nocardioides sp.]
MTIDGEQHTMTAVYPDQFPYFKPFVTGPDLGYANHFNPTTGEYCLLQSSGGVWRPATDTLAYLLTTQLDQVVLANTRPDLSVEELASIEVPQAEPVSVYVSTDNSEEVVIVDSSLTVGEATRGTAQAIYTARDPLRAYLVQLADHNGVLLSGPVPEPMDNLHESWDRVELPWVMLPAAPRSSYPPDWVDAVRAIDPDLDRRAHHFDPPRRTGVKQEQLVLVGFPEEIGHRTHGRGWVIIARRRARNNRSWFSRLVRVAQAGRDDLFRREPTLRTMADKSVLVVGLGGLGGQVASLLGCTVVKELRTWDGDVVDPATAVRVPAAFANAGRPKVVAVNEGLAATQPYTRVGHAFGRLGIPRLHPDEEQHASIAEWNEWVAGCDLIIDATADYGVQHYLSDLARNAGIGYLRTEATPGVWAGRIALQRPAAEVCWMCWQHYLTDETLPQLPHAPAGVQPPGCSEPTYTGAGFDLAAIAAQTVRVATGFLTGDDGYGETPADVMTVQFRDNDGKVVLPTWAGHDVEQHPDCPHHG